MRHEDAIVTALDRALKRLPDETAPASLVPAVLARIRAEESRPWWQRSWFCWPRVWQALSASAALGLLAGLVVIPLFPGLAEPAASVLGLFAAIGEFVRGLAGLAIEETSRLLGALSPTLLALLLGAFVMSWTTCVGLGAFCWRQVRWHK